MEGKKKRGGGIDTHRAVVRQPGHHLQLFERDLVDLVDGVDRRDVDARALDDVDEVVDVAVACLPLKVFLRKKKK